MTTSILDEYVDMLKNIKSDPITGLNKVKPFFENEDGKYYRTVSYGDYMLLVNPQKASYVLFSQKTGVSELNKLPAFTEIEIKDVKSVSLKPVPNNTGPNIYNVIELVVSVDVHYKTEPFFKGNAFQLKEYTLYMLPVNVSFKEVSEGVTKKLGSALNTVVNSKPIKAIQKFGDKTVGFFTKKQPVAVSSQVPQPVQQLPPQAPSVQEGIDIINNEITKNNTNLEKITTTTFNIAKPVKSSITKYKNNIEEYKSYILEAIALYNKYISLNNFLTSTSTSTIDQLKLNLQNNQTLLSLTPDKVTNDYMSKINTFKTSFLSLKTKIDETMKLVLINIIGYIVNEALSFKINQLKQDYIDKDTQWIHYNYDSSIEKDTGKPSTEKIYNYNKNEFITNYIKTSEVSLPLKDIIIDEANFKKEVERRITQKNQFFAPDKNPKDIIKLCNNLFSTNNPFTKEQKNINIADTDPTFNLLLYALKDYDNNVDETISPGDSTDYSDETKKKQFIKICIETINNFSLILNIKKDKDLPIINLILTFINEIFKIYVKKENTPADTSSYIYDLTRINLDDNIKTILTNFKTNSTIPYIVFKNNFALHLSILYMFQELLNKNPLPIIISMNPFDIPNTINNTINNTLLDKYLEHFNKDVLLAKPVPPAPPGPGGALIRYKKKMYKAKYSSKGIYIMVDNKRKYIERFKEAKNKKK